MPSTFSQHLHAGRVNIPTGRMGWVDFSKSLLEGPITRSKPMYWEYGRNASYLRPAEPKDRSPVLAIREVIEIAYECRR